MPSKKFIKEDGGIQEQVRASMEELKHMNDKDCPGKFKSQRSSIYLFGFYVAFNTVQVISRWVVGRAEETSTYSSLGFCTVNCRPTASNYQLSHLRP